MAESVEVLITGTETPRGNETLKAAAIGAVDAGMKVLVTDSYIGTSDWLCLHAAGQVKRRVFLYKHIAKLRLVACWDHAYVGRGDYMRVSVNGLHPTLNLMDRTEPEPSRWDAHGIALRDDYDPAGQVVVIGVGGRKRAQKGNTKWETQTIRAARQRFPKRQIVFRPKPGLGITERLGADICDDRPDIADVLRGASLMICQHSNAAVDACIAGIPVQCSDGAATWLYRTDSSPSREARLDFLRRASWWQWRLDEMADAWRFLNAVTSAKR